MWFCYNQAEVDLAAPPRDGEANAEITQYIAKLLGVPKAAVKLISGHKNREKVLSVEGIDADQTRKILAACK